jgi:hypothetical protein
MKNKQNEKNSKLRWLEKGHVVTYEFFVVVKQCNSHLLVTKLENEMEEVVSFQVGLEAWCKEFYSKLHIKEACDTNFVEIKNDFLRILKNKIHEHMKCNLTQPTTKAKLVTLNTMAKGKGLGPNGVVVEVFQRVW